MPTQAAAQMNLEDIMLSEIRQTQKKVLYEFHFVESPWNRQIHRNREQKGAYQVQGGGVEENEELLFMEQSVRLV